MAKFKWGQCHLKRGYKVQAIFNQHNTGFVGRHSTKRPGAPYKRHE